MRLLGITLLGLLLCSLASSAQTVQRTSDPYQEEYFSCAGKPDGRLFNSDYESYGYGRFRIRADLNFDGREDLILSRSERNDGTGCGNGGCDVRIYLKQPDGAYVSIPFGLHPLATALKIIKPGEGQFVTYWHSSGDEGSLTSFRVGSDSITTMDDRTLHLNSSDGDLALYNSWFGANLALKAEFARCAKGQLQWTESYR
jgi:hypothetical protein